MHGFFNVFFQEKAAAAEKKALEQERKEMYEKQKMERKDTELAMMEDALDRAQRVQNDVGGFLEYFCFDKLY